jgi:threonyl-tRNA synthetase
MNFARDIEQQAEELGLRIYVDNSNDSVGKKIRAAEISKVPYVIVVGEKEISSKQLVPRIRKDLSDKESSLSIDDFLQAVASEARSRQLKSSL